MSCDSYNTIPAFKECAGINCNKEPIIKIKIKFIKKFGYFCKSCYLELKALDLIDGEVIDVDKQRVGSSSLNNRNGNK